MAEKDQLFSNDFAAAYPHLFQGIAQIDRRAQLKGLLEKWDQTGLLKNLDGVQRANMAVLLENEAAELYKQMRNLSESTSYTNDIAGFNKIAFPLVRRIFAQLIANEIVSIQPMSLPSGLLFYLDFKYDESKPSHYRSGRSVYGDLGSSGDTTLEGIGWRTVSGAFYGYQTSYSQRFFRSGGSISAADGSATAWVMDEDGGQIMGYRAIVAFGANITSVDLTSLRQMEVVNTSYITNSNDPTFRGFTAVRSVSGGHEALLVPGTTDLDTPLVDSTGVLTSGRIAVYFYSDSALQAATGDELLFVANTDLTNRGDFEFVSDIPEINIEIKSVAVTAQTRKLKAVWTPELAQDINAYHGLDAEVELTTILSEHIATEIDREILQDLILAARRAKMFDVWSRKIGKYVRMDERGVIHTETNITGILGMSSGGYGPVFHGTQKDWYQTLLEKVTGLGNEIHKRTLRGAANFMVTSPDISTILEATQSFKPNLAVSPDVTQYNVAIERMGTMNNKYVLYKDPYFPRGLILMGYKGTRFLEAGYVYAPYVPLVITPTIFDPQNFTPRKGVMTRYGKQVVRPEFYGLIYVIDLNLL